ncbi:nitrate ABC transporter, permease protein [Dulcicalothrix desertica PCC 7102]|uniref:Nitrate ABC transporter, permease protein n=1 Tax=Dulcicalothrix desertica PCC 7102 TaxID=232991 RepID=A0A433V5D7_9CYAN|nr:nitrate ABC transporter permease [Dulcicalothrix desertica]RUT01271.1 nitrate ABC transporter, permease protein [Dulcicalothrix desertica PCC 7102]TWH40578.1 nitrate/nitrite transport system permease protein [Dulcicalothrix desertica PCC 7102]
MAVQAGRFSTKNSSSKLVAQIGKNSKKAIPPLVAVLIFLVVWQILCSAPSSEFPGPIKILSDPTVQKLLFNPFLDDDDGKGLAFQLLASLQRVGYGYFFAATIGIALGVLTGTNRLMFEALDPIFQILRTVPPLAWLPIALSAVPTLGGISKSEVAAIFVIFITAVWPIVINTTTGVQQIPQDYRNVARVLRLKGRKYFFKILFPAAVPYIFSGLRIGIGLAWLAIVAAEMVNAGSSDGAGGLGFFIWDAYNSGDMGQVVLALVYIGVVGLLLDRAIGFVASLVIPAEQK